MVVLWLRLVLPMQGASAQSLVRGLNPSCRMTQTKIKAKKKKKTHKKQPHKAISSQETRQPSQYLQC